MSTEAPEINSGAPPPGATSASPITAAPITQSTPATTAVVEPYYKSWLQSDGKLDSTALDRLPTHLAHLKPSLEKVGTMDDVLNIFANQQILAGKKGLAPLPDNAPDNVRAERKALLDSINGVPKDIAAYGIKKPEGVPDEAWNPKLGEGFAKWCQDNSVSPKAAQKLIEINMGNVKEQLAEQAQYETKFFAEQDSKFAALIKAENIPADKAQQLIERGAQRLGLDMADPSVAALMKNSNARAMALRHAIATGEDRFVDGKSTASGPANSIDAAKDIIHNKANPKHEAYWNRSGGDPRAKSVREEVEQLMRVGAAKGAK